MDPKNKKYTNGEVTIYGSLENINHSANCGTIQIFKPIFNHYPYSTSEKF